MAAARTNAKMVQEVLLDDYGPRADRTLPSLTRFIRAAGLLVARMQTCATGRGLTFTTEELTEIETWLAAHFYVQSDQPYAFKGTQAAQANFQGKTGMHLENSKYGQTAMVLDTSGCLRAIGGSAQTANRGRFVWLGKNPSEQTDYADRD